jgi:hypothetical protein
LSKQTLFFFREVNHPVARIHGGGHPGTGLFVKTLTARLNQDPRAALQPEEQAFVANCVPRRGPRAGSPARAPHASDDRHMSPECAGGLPGRQERVRIRVRPRVARA